MKVDLHTHSYFSDGAHAPAYVVGRARENGVTHLALTDHDCLDGYLEAVTEIALAHEVEPLALIPGVEISTRWQNLEIHIIGLHMNTADNALNALLQSQQEKRRDRLSAIEAILVRAGVNGLGEYIRSLPCTAPGRAHVAHFLAGRSRSASPRKAFRALARNGRFYVAPQWCQMQDAVAQIRAAGGMAVLAHPHRYPVSRRGLLKLLTDFRESGGDALELGYANAAEEQLTALTALCLDLGLWISVGSDFHNSEATWIDIGRIRPLPETIKKNAIWLHPRWHSS